MNESLFSSQEYDTKNYLLWLSKRRKKLAYIRPVFYLVFLPKYVLFLYPPIKVILVIYLF